MTIENENGQRLEWIATRGFSWMLLSLSDKLELAEDPKDYQILDGYWMRSTKTNGTIKMEWTTIKWYIRYGYSARRSESRGGGL